MNFVVQALSKVFCLVAIGIVLFIPSHSDDALAQDDMVAVSHSAAEAKPDLIPTAYFATRGSLWNAKLSPDGSHISYVRRFNGKLEMIVNNIDDKKMIRRVRFADGTAISSYEWVNDDKLVLRLSSVLTIGGWYVRRSRIALLEPSKSGIKYLIKDPNGLSEEIIHTASDGSYALVAHKGDGRYYFPAVYRYPLEPGAEGQLVQKPKKNVWSWVADDSGAIRLGLGWQRKKLHIWYRTKAEDELERIAKIKPGDDDTFFDVLQIVSGSDRGYVLDENAEGRVGVRLYDYAKREVVETFYENPDWDVDDLWVEDGKPIAAFYTDDREQVVWFDDTNKQTYQALQKALPGMQVSVTSRAKSGGRMLAWVNSEADPGVLYLFDSEKRTLDELAQFRPKIDFRQLATPSAFTYQARDGTDIRAYLTLPKGREANNLPLIILPHGGPFGIRDQLRYDDEVQFLANRGYAVIQPNFRGSGGYGDDFYELGVGQVGRGMQDDLDDAMDWAVAKGIADKSRVCVVGGSYGGYAALWAVLRNPERYRCAASWAGVTDWDRMLRYDRRYLTNKAGRRWQNKIEGDDKDFDLKDVSPYKLARNLRRPVLLAHGTDDSNVPIKQFDQMVKAAAKAPVKPETLRIVGEGHSFSRADSEQQWYDALDGFLAKHNPADQLAADGSFVAPKVEEEQDPNFKPVELPDVSAP